MQHLIGRAGTPPHPAARLIAGRVLFWAALAGTAAVFVLRLPGIVQPLGPDQGVYTTIAWGLQHDLALYRDLWEQKPPAIYLTYLLGFTMFGTGTQAVFWIDYLAAGVAVLAVFGLSRALVDAWFGAWAAAAVAVGTLPAARHAYGGFLERAVTETFIIPLAALAAWAAVVWLLQRRDRWALAAGLCIGIAAVYKQTALIYWPALALWALCMAGPLPALRFTVHAAAGVVIAPAAALLWLWSQGVLGDAWIALVEYNLAYLAVGDQGPAYTFTRFAQELWRRMRGDEVWALGSLSAVAAVFAWRTRATPSGRVALLGVIWLGASMIATVANGPRLFTTYFMPSLVPLSLLSAWLLHETLASGRRWRVAAGVVVVLAAGAMLVKSGSANRTVSATRWDARHLFGQTDREAYLQRFRSRATRAFSAADNERLAAYLAEQTAPQDRIFVFGMTASAYFSSRRLPASRFLWAYPPVSNMIDRPDFRAETLAAELARAAPAYIILQRHNGDSFSGWRAAEAFQAPPLQALIGSDYREETEIGDFVLYRRNRGQAP